MRTSLRGVLSCCISLRGRTERTGALSGGEAMMGGASVSGDLVGMGVADVTETEGT